VLQEQPGVREVVRRGGVDVAQGALNEASQALLVAKEPGLEMRNGQRKQ
jgi:hypothetical protein